MQLARQRAADPGGRESTLLWLLAAGVVVVVAGLLVFLVIETPRGEQQARSEAAAEQLAGWLQSAGFDPTEIDVTLEPTPGTFIRRGGGGVSMSPRVMVLVEQVPVAVTWKEPRAAGSLEEGPDHLQVGGRTLELGEATQQEGRASAWFDCGATSLHVLVDARWDLGAAELPPDGGRDEALAVATGLAETVPCPVRHPDLAGQDAEGALDGPMT